MSGALLEKIPLLGGEFEICRFANKPRFWWFRQYIPAGETRTTSAPTSSVP